MGKLADLRAAADVRAEGLADPDVRAEYERTALASAVALRVVSYRAAHDLTQAELARRLGLAQPAVARIEAGEHTPTFATLQRLARGLGVEFHIDITPESAGLRDTA